MSQIYSLFGSPFLGALSQGIGFGLGYGMGVNVGYNAASRFTEPKSRYKYTSTSAYHYRPYRGYYARQNSIIGGRDYSSSDY